MKYFKIFILTLALLFSGQNTARADFFGGELVYLAQILEQSIQQLAQLKLVLENGQDTLNLLQDINRGINDSMSMLRTISPNVDPKLFKNLQNVDTVLNHIQSIYGIAINSSEAQVQNNSDQVVAEAIGLNNQILDYTKTIDNIGEEIKSFSHQVSPGGAAKLTAQSLGVMLHVMNEQLRAQGTTLKLQAQQLAAQNKKDKDTTAQFINETTILKSAIQNNPITFSRPRF